MIQKIEIHLIRVSHAYKKYLAWEDKPDSNIKINP